MAKSASTALSSASVTQESLTFPIDYNDPGAVDYNASDALHFNGVKFVSQAQITQFLAAYGATHFKYIMDCWDSLPDIIQHDVNFNLAVGVHRPRTIEPGNPYAQVSFPLIGKTIIGTHSVNVNGSGPSTYTQLVASQAITGLSADTRNPWADFAGTPFAGLDLRGYYAVFDTGQTSLIHQHTASRLYFLDVASPTPASCFVGKPSTIIRNSYNDSTPAKTGPSMMLGCGNTDMWLTLELYDLLFEDFASTFGIQLVSGDPYLVRIMFDMAHEYDEFGTNVTSHRPIEIWWYNVVGSLTINQLSMRGPGFATPPQSIGSCTPIFWSYYNGAAAVYSSYFGGTASFYSTERCWFYILNTVFDSCEGAIYLGEGSSIGSQEDASWYPMGYLTTIRNCSSYGLWLDHGAIWQSDLWYGLMRFEGCTGPCVILGTASRIVSVAPLPKFINGPAGGNTNVGFEFRGTGAQINIDTNTNVSGTIGDILMADGIISYATALSAGLVEDSAGNIVKIS